MPAPLQALENWAAALTARLGPAASLQLARGIALDLRRRNMARMRAQQDPGGQAWPPRKGQSIRQRGTRRAGKTGPMMRKMATAQYLRTRATAAQASVEFAARVQRIAQEHHWSLRGAVNYPRGPLYDYPARALLGLADDDLEQIRDLILRQVSGAR